MTRPLTIGDVVVPLEVEVLIPELPRECLPLVVDIDGEFDLVTVAMPINRPPYVLEIAGPADRFSLVTRAAIQ